MNRRRFLKYAGATAAVVGASALGLVSLQPSTPVTSVGTTSTKTASSAASTSPTTATTITTTTPNRVELSFFFDPDLDGILDPHDVETKALDLVIKTSGQDQPLHDNKVVVASDSLVDLTIQGVSPFGKQLTTATYDEPHMPVGLPSFSYRTSANSVSIGLADGPATSPIKPSDMNMDDYEYYRLHPKEWRKKVAEIYPPGLPYEPNYFFYGYLRPNTYGVPEGKPHLAFDIWAADGKPVHACWGGKIVRGLYDWKFGIDSGSHIAYYNHLVPTVHVGDFVLRYDVVGHIEEGLGHVHFELRPDPTAILNIFTTKTTKDVLKSPLRGESVSKLPYFSKS